MILKRCSKCKYYKSINLFYRNSQTRDGHHGHCKKCKSDRHKIYLKDPETYARVVRKIKEWEKGKGREKYKILRKKYDTSPKRVAWRRKRYFATKGMRVDSLEEALIELDKRKAEVSECTAKYQK